MTFGMASGGIAQQTDDWTTAATATTDESRRRRHDDAIDSMLAANMFATTGGNGNPPSADVQHAFAISLGRHRRSTIHPSHHHHEQAPPSVQTSAQHDQQQQRVSSQASRGISYQLQAQQSQHQPQHQPQHHAHYTTNHQSHSPPQNLSTSHNPHTNSPSTALSHPLLQTGRIPSRHLPGSLPAPPGSSAHRNAIPYQTTVSVKREKLPCLPSPPRAAPRALALLMSASPETLTPCERRRVRKALRAQRANRRGSSTSAPPDLPRARPSPADGAMLSALDKKTARVIRNREVALRARQAAKAKMQRLESENSTLKNKASDLERENGALKLQIESLKESLQRGDNWAGDVSIESVIAP